MNMEEAIRDPVIPFVGGIGGRLTPGKIIRIQGAVPGIAYRFDVNLQCGAATAPRDDIALQISVRILDGYITMNSLQNGIWGEELRGHTQPIKRADRFEIIIMCGFDQYKIITNGQLFYDFPQKIHCDRVTHLTIEGDVFVNEIFYGSQENPMTRSGPVPVTIRQTPNDFEIINAHGSTDSQPPSYSDVVQNYPANGHQYPLKVGMPYPIVAPYPSASSSYTSPSAPNMTLPPVAMPIPLNAASSNFRPVQKSRRKKICGYFWGILIGALIIIIVIVMKVKRSSVHVVHHNNYVGSDRYSSNVSPNSNYNWR